MQCSLPPMKQRRGTRWLQSGDSRRAEQHLLAEPRSERSVIRLDLNFTELIGVWDEPQLSQANRHWNHVTPHKDRHSPSVR